MSYTYDLVTSVGLIRLNTFQQTDAADPIFQDEELTALYTQEGSSVKRASARVLEIVASRENYIQKAIKLLSLSTNGPAVAAEFRAQAALLRAQADNEVPADGTATFDVAEWAVTPFAEREIIYGSLYGD